MPSALWTQRREASLNWLALGLLLAAWNAADDRRAAQRRPGFLARLPYVTVRTMTRIGSTRFGAIGLSGRVFTVEKTDFSIKGHKSVNEL